MGWTAARMPDLPGQVAVVTGANSGIGWQTAKGLADSGARVVLACRDLVRGTRAVDKLRSSIENADVDVAPLDLSSMASVRSFAHDWSGRLDLLVNNAGVMAPPRAVKTEDGFELQFGTNHLAHFVLTGLLLGALHEAPLPRVVTVASLAHHGGGEDVLDANAGPYNPAHAYANSKLANLLFADELGRQARAHDSRLISVAAHPGVSATGLFGDREGMGANRLIRTFSPMFTRAFTQPSSAGARAVLFAAVEGEPGSYTGPQHFRETRGAIGPARRSDLGQDVRLARRLWHASEELTGFHYAWPVGDALSAH